ncbi:MAG: RlmE family RNA methyltransferase [Methanomassiliicoccales archaeon]|jgi:23S rRNA (uridine2552-2'-O)-methyltransferase|nr:RlmE family RNA methyltransferase [Methanomassiliicoccales archaeon]
MTERRNDPYSKAAKRMDYRSRASFKLIQIDDKFKLLKRGAVVADLGAAPGGWLQVAAERVEPKGKVVGVDLQPIEPIEGVETVQGDMRKEETVLDMLEALGGKADVVLSDMSPNISGSYSMDHARSVDLCEHALEFAEKVLRPGGAMVLKIFEGDMMQEFLKRVKSSFKEVKLYGPDASRASSSEIYIIARDFIRK